MNTTTIASALASPFDLGDVTPEIVLDHGPGILRRGMETLELDDMTAFLSCRPTLAIKVRGEGNSANPNADRWIFEQWQPSRVKFPDLSGFGSLYRDGVDLGGTISVFPTQISMEGRLRELHFGSSSRPLRSILFHVLNFPNFIGGWIPEGQGGWRGRLRLTGPEWTITLESRQNWSDLEREVGRRGGLAISHVGLIERSDGRLFSPKAGKEALESLHWFLSFVRGAWSSPVLFLGRSARGVTTWRYFSGGRTDSGRTGFSWTDLTTWPAVQEGYHQFEQLWKIPAWKQGLKLAVALYVSANKPNPTEVAIVSGQSGLELLGWLRFVEFGSIAPNDWNNSKIYRASRKIRDLNHLAQVPSAIPRKLSALSALRQSYPDWKDGPDVVAGVRNRLVHPKRKGGTVSWSPQILLEAWLLTSTYLELGILHVLDVRSKIRDRLGKSPYVGATAKPPWVR